MASTRLTKDMRVAIRDNAIRHRFGPDVADLVRDFRDLAEAVYNETYGSIRSRMEELPDGWMPTTGSMSVQLGATYTSLNFDGDFPSRQYTSDTHNLVGLQGDIKDIWRRVPDAKKGTCHNSFDARHELSTRHDILRHAAGGLNDLVAKTKRDLYSALDNFTTVEKLLEGWPEIQPFTVGVTPAPKTTLPAVPVAALNSALGLPV